jgi:hypothetical protein
MATVDLLERIESYDKPWCYQYDRKLQLYNVEKERLGWTDEEIANINLNDFVFEYVDSKKDKKEVGEFVKKFEWLGTIPNYPTHWFKGTYKGEMMCAVIMSMPNSFSKIMGEGSDKIERLVARGCSHPFCPKNIGSKFLSWCCKWMVNNTQYRVFYGYSDSAAKELGTIYQSLNWFFLGQNSGGTVKCINPYDSTKVVSDRIFRCRSFYKHYAKDLGIEWQKNWNDDTKMLWENVPDDIEKKLRDYSKEMFAKAEKIKVKPKGKYAFVLGKDKRETKALRKKFLELNKIYEYPKERGK